MKAFVKLMTSAKVIIIAGCIFLLADLALDRVDWGTYLLAVIVLLLAFFELREKMHRVRRVEREDQPTYSPTEGFKRRPEPGDRRYSPFFDSELELVEYVRDDSYTFKVLEGHRRGLVFKNQSPWSALPLYRPRVSYRGSSPRPGGGYRVADTSKEAGVSDIEPERTR